MNPEVVVEERENQIRDLLGRLYEIKMVASSWHGEDLTACKVSLEEISRLADFEYAERG